MCAEPDFPTSRDQTLCGKHDAGTVFVQLDAHWLIAMRRKVRLRAQRLIPPADICSAPSRRSIHDAIFDAVSGPRRGARVRAATTGFRGRPFAPWARMRSREAGDLTT